MMYGSETWTLYRHHIKHLRTIQQRHLRSMLKIRWDHSITNDEILDLAKSSDIIEIIPIRNRLRWMGHVARVPDERPVKALLFGILEEGSRRVGLPLITYKDTLEEILKRGAALGIWREIVTDGLAWRRLASDIWDKIEIKRRNRNMERKAKRHDIRGGADSNLESSLTLNLVFTTSFLYSSAFFYVVLVSGYRGIYISKLKPECYCGAN